MLGIRQEIVQYSKPWMPRLFPSQSSSNQLGILETDMVLQAQFITAFGFCSNFWIAEIPRRFQVKWSPRTFSKRSWTRWLGIIQNLAQMQILQILPRPPCSLGVATAHPGHAHMWHSFPLNQSPDFIFLSQSPYRTHTVLLVCEKFTVLLPSVGNNLKDLAIKSSAWSNSVSSVLSSGPIRIYL